jgi:uroporphyrinogen decarboxylase
MVMTRRERLLAALKMEQPDRVPMFDFLFQQPMYEELIGHKPGVYNAIDALKCALALEHDGVWLPFGGFSGFEPKFLDEKTYIDEWGTTYQRDDASWPIDAPVDYPIKSPENLRAYHPPDPTLPGRDEQIVIAAQNNKEDIALLGGIVGPLSQAWLLMGYEAICFALYDNPEMVTECFKISNEYNKEAARRSVEAGCHGIWLSEDLGDSNSGFMSTDLFRRYLLPYIVEITEYVDGLGVPVLLHSCGCIKQYLDDLAQTKIASIHPLQRTAGMDLKEVKQKYGKRFCIIGNVDSSRTLPYGTPEDVAAETKEAIEIAAPGGGYVLASDHSLHDGIPVENIIAIRDVGLTYGAEIYNRK